MTDRRKQLFPEPTVGGLILNSAGSVLVVRSPKWKDRYTVPGGHIEVGETMEEALRREIKEEVGLKVSGIKPLMTQEAIFSDEFWKPMHYIFFDFVCRSGDQVPRVDGREIVAYRWVRPRHALKLKLDAYTKRLIKKYLSESEVRPTRGARQSSSR